MRKDTRIPPETRHKITHEWLRLIVNDRPVDALEDLSLGQINTLLDTLIAASGNALYEELGLVSGNNEATEGPLSIDLDSMLERLIGSYERHDHSFTLLLFDFGETDLIELEEQDAQDSDRDLAAVSQMELLEETVRVIDWVVPVEGNSYAVLLPETGAEAAAAARERIATEVAQESGGNSSRQRFSVASAVCPDDAVMAGEIVEIARARLEPYIPAEVEAPVRHLRLTA